MWHGGAGGGSSAADAALADGDVPWRRVLAALDARSDDDAPENFDSEFKKRVERSSNGQFLIRIHDYRIFPSFVGEDYVRNYTDKPRDAEGELQIGKRREEETLAFRQDAEAARKEKELEDRQAEARKKEEARVARAQQKRRERSRTPPRILRGRGEWESFVWEALLRDDVLQLERSCLIWPGIVEHPSIDYQSMLAPPELTTSSRSGLLFERCEGTVHKFKEKEGWIRYKFGVTKDPVHRWENIGDYKTEFKQMRLLLCTTSKALSDTLEAHLIRIFKYQGCRNKERGEDEGEDEEPMTEDPLCRNKRPGGEGPLKDDPPHFTYVVIR